MVAKTSGHKNKHVLGIAARRKKNVDLIVKTSVVVGEDDDDDLNEGFCHYSIMDDE